MRSPYRLQILHLDFSLDIAVQIQNLKILNRPSQQAVGKMQSYGRALRFMIFINFYILSCHFTF